MRITGLEHERIVFINKLMDELDDSNTIIYESLCDREHKETQAEIKLLISRLKSLHDSLEDEVWKNVELAKKKNQSPNFMGEASSTSKVKSIWTHNVSRVKQNTNTPEEKKEKIG